MEMSEAAEYFGVKAPSGRRDRKSGAKKRKQHEIEEARGVVKMIRGQQAAQRSSEQNLKGA